VVFPLHVLPVVSALVGLVQVGISLVLFAVAAWAVRGGVPLTALSLPLVWVPLVTVTLGLSYFLAAMGVFLRDLGQVIGPLLWAPLRPPAAGDPRSIRPSLLPRQVGLARRLLRPGAGLGDGSRRPQRRWEEHPAPDHRGHPGTFDGKGGSRRARGCAARVGVRLQRRVHRPRERLPVRRAP